MRFEPLPDRLSYPEIEKEILRWWEEQKIFQKSLEQRQGAPRFVFYEGPPTVNGQPGIHHLMARTLKDLVCRYKTMRGFYVYRKAGWDTHGLPIEIAVEKKLGLTYKKQIEEYGIDRFNAECKKLVEYYIETDQGWRALTQRMGYWIDLDNAYITCSNEYIESLWWAIKEFYSKGLIYKDFKIVPISPTIETPLSSHELALGYKEVRDPSVFIKVAVTESAQQELHNAFLLVWTTTPWTLIGNAAIAVGPDIDYVLVRNRRTIKEKGKDPITVEEHLLLAEARLEVLDGDYEILHRYKGTDLVGTRYEQIFPYEKIDLTAHPNALSVLPADFVSTEEGTGLVHIAPAFGADDFELGKKYNLPLLQPVLPNGRFKDYVTEFAGRPVKTFQYADGHIEEGTDKDLVRMLKRMGKLYKASFDYLHTYPHCWRTGNPIIYYAQDSWFINSPAYRDRMVELNQHIRWQPPEIGSGRFGNWLAEAKEWALSRTRYWGTPLPIWVSEDGEDIIVIGSIEELMGGWYEEPDGTRVPMSEKKGEIDLHRPFVDRIIFERNGKIYRRVPEIIDVWFDSGAMPFAQFHYPFENCELFRENFPADFIAEGVDQTRGWFYTLHNIATALFDQPAYKSVIVNELILDKHGVKMSKSRGNVVDPFQVMEEFGADAVRWYFMVNNPPWKPTLFNSEDIRRTVLSDFFRALTNTYAFFALYANIDDFDPTTPPIPVDQRPEIDRWILSRLHSLLKAYGELMDAYEVTRIARMIQHFTIDDLSNWYVRRNRRRFWKGDKDDDKLAAYQTLHTLLLTLSMLIAPFAPFLAEYLYRKLRTDDLPESVHLCLLPSPDPALIDETLEQQMQRAQIIASLGRALREKAKIRVRQPLRRILVAVRSEEEKHQIQHVEDLIKEELNIKRIEYISDDSPIVQREIKPNYATLGKRFRKLTNAVANAIRQLNDDQLRILEDEGKLELTVNETTVEIYPEDVQVYYKDIEGWMVAADQGIVVALDTTIDEQLRQEGFARELINRIQNLRKSSGFNVTDRIVLRYNAPESIRHIIEAQRSTIAQEVLAHHILFDPQITDGTEITIDNLTLSVKLERIVPESETTEG